MLENLYKDIKKKKSTTVSNVHHFLEQKHQYIVFLSATDQHQQALVTVGKAETLESSWQQAVQALKKRLYLERTKPVWLKADLITNVEPVTFHELMEEISIMTLNNFRKGVSFDKYFRIAFLNEEMIANDLIHYKERNNIVVSTSLIQAYLKNERKSNLKFSMSGLSEVYLFDTIHSFHDEYGVQEQSFHEFSRRPNSNKEQKLNEVYEMIQKTAEHLSKRVLENGQFRYIYYPTTHRESVSYNILQHASTVFTMLEAYEVTKEKELLEAIEKALDFIMNDSIIYYQIQEQDCAFVIEKNNDEIKLGANAFALLAFIKYKEITENPKYGLLIDSLAIGTLVFQNEDGSFLHVLSKDLQVKEAFRTAFYDGQAMLAFVAYYRKTQNAYLLSQIEKSFHYFIENKYWKQGNSWLNKAVNLLFKYTGDRKYAEFILEGVAYHLNNALTHSTTATTLLDFLLSSKDTITLMKSERLHNDLLSMIDEKKLNRAITYRLNYQLNNYLSPEKAMYFKVPNDAVYSFYQYAPTLQIQIDDVATNLSGYCHYYQMVQQDADVEMEDDTRLNMQEISTLSKAKRYQKNGKWEQAVRIFNENIDESYQYMDVTYISYAESLRMVGETNKARHILMVGNKIYPSNEDILLEYLILCSFINDWQSILAIVGDLIKIKPKEAKYYFELGRAYAETQQGEKAKAAFKIGLIYQQDMGTEQLAETIQKRITKEPGGMISDYTFLGGRNNLGMFTHSIHGLEYVTKIIRIGKGILPEKMYYEEILKEYESLQKIVPEFKDAYILNDTLFITMEKMEKITRKIGIDEIIQASTEISKIGYQDIIQSHPNPRYEFVLKNGIGDSVVKFFTLIHKKEQNEDLFKTAKVYAEQNGLQGVGGDIIDRLENIFMNRQLYEYLLPEKHYSLLHGDFKTDNMALKKDGALQIIDWGSYVVGPSFMDMANFFTTLPIPIEGIKESYLDNETIEKKLSTIEQMFFLYGYIMIQFVKIKPENQESLIADFIMPALAELEALVEEFESLK